MHSQRLPRGLLEISHALAYCIGIQRPFLALSSPLLQIVRVACIGTIIDTSPQVCPIVMHTSIYMRSQPRLLQVKYSDLTSLFQAGLCLLDGVGCNQAA